MVYFFLSLQKQVSWYAHNRALNADFYHTLFQNINLHRKALDKILKLKVVLKKSMSDVIKLVIAVNWSTLYIGCHHHKKFTNLTMLYKHRLIFKKPPCIELEIRKFINNKLRKNFFIKKILNNLVRDSKKVNQTHI